MDEEYSLFIPEDISTNKEFGFGLEKADTKKAVILSLIGGAPIALSYFLTHSDMFSIIGTLTWIFISFGGYAKMPNGKRHSFEQAKIMLNFRRCQKYFPYQYKEEWR